MSRLAHEKSSSPWIKCPHPREDARLRLVCFPHAGGTASVYHQWGRMISADIEVWAIELPGHGSRFFEPPGRSLEQAANTVAEELNHAGLSQLPFALFGHSMGGLLAFEVARKFRHSPMFKHLFASGCHAPQLDFTDLPIHALPTEDFLEVMIQRYGGIPEAILREKDLLEFILPALRADMEMIECHRYQVAPPLPMPITSLAGHDDERATQEVLGGWSLQTSDVFEIHRFAGGHFYLQNAAGAVIEMIEAKLLGKPNA